MNKKTIGLEISPNGFKTTICFFQYQIPEQTDDKNRIMEIIYKAFFIHFIPLLWNAALFRYLVSRTQHFVSENVIKFALLM